MGVGVWVCGEGVCVGVCGEDVCVCVWGGGEYTLDKAVDLKVELCTHRHVASRVEPG